MLELGRDLNFPAKPLAAPAPALERMDFDNHEPVQRYITGQEHPRLPPATKLALDPEIRPQSPGNLFVKIRRLPL